MNAEYLLDTIGRLDDDLVQEAERYRRPKARYGRLMGWAACFAVVIALGYVLTHVGGMGRGAAPSFSGGGNGAAPASGNSDPSGGDMFPGNSLGAPNAAADGSSGEAIAPEAPGETAISSGKGLSDQAQVALPGTVFVRGAHSGGTYALGGELLAELPEDGEFVLLGQLLEPGPDFSPLYTDAEEYVGLNLWAENDGTDLPPTVYVELPEGGFAEAVLMQP